MKEQIQSHKTIQTYANNIKEIVDKAVRERRTPEELKEEIQNLCVKCMLPPTEDCQICNGTQVNDQLYINFEWLSEE